MNLNKRHKIIITSVIITIGFIIATQNANIIFKKYFFIYGLGIITYIFSLWSLSEGMNKTKAFVLLILPVFLSVGMALFYYTFREIRWLTRIPVGLLLGASFYLLLLSQNVFNVSSARTIPLYRAASSANFIFTIITLLFWYSIIFSLNLQFYWNGVLVFIVGFLLFLQIFWTLKMEGIDQQLMVYSFVLALMLGECALALSFWQVSVPFIRSLFLTPISYVLLGIQVDSMKERLNRKDVLIYAGLGGGLFLFTYLVILLYI